MVQCACLVSYDVMMVPMTPNTLLSDDTFERQTVVAEAELS